MPNVIMLSMLSVFMLNAVMHSVVIRGVGMLTVILSVIMLNPVMQSVFLHSVVMVSVIKLNVVMQCSYE
jgi:hypothetical protein